MADPYVGWKFGADIKQRDGHFMPSTCYVAISDQDAAKQALADAHPDVAFHSSHGEHVTGEEWKRVFEAEPGQKEIRIA